MTKDLYVKREKLISQIPNFWSLAFTQAPSEVDEYIQPTDSTVFVNSLKNLTVERFELPDGDPRSISIKFEFEENEFFEDKTIEKKFWWRNAKDGWSGLVSEPVSIKWKSADKDLTSGMLDLANQIYAEQKDGKAAPSDETEAKTKIVELMENEGLGGVSFFCFFGYAGRYITEEEHKAATIVEAEKRKLRKEGKNVDEDEEDEEEEDGFDEFEYEIFPMASDVAVAIVEDVWPSAIRYFIDAQELQAMSDMDFEDEDEDEEMDDDELDGQPSPKKQKA